MADWYSPSPAIPPGLDPSGWRSMIEAVEVETRRMLTGRPGTVGGASRLRSLAANLESAGLSASEAAVGSRILGEYFAPALAKSRRVLLQAQSAHGDAAVTELADFLDRHGFPAVSNRGALAATVARTQAQITADWERLAATTQAAVVDALRGGMAAGSNPAVVARRIGQAGSLSYSRGLNIARTEMRDLYTASRLDYMRDAEAIKGWWWRARPDACGICQALHGERFPTDAPQLAHHQCRCIMMPLVPGVTDPDDSRPASKIEAQLPGSWPKGKSRDYWRGQVKAGRNEGWRPSYRMTKP